jgi:hypothetical protein
MCSFCMKIELIFQRALSGNRLVPAVFDHSNTGVVSSDSTRGMSVCMSVFELSCVGRGLGLLHFHVLETASALFCLSDLLLDQEYSGSACHLCSH